MASCGALDGSTLVATLPDGRVEAEACMRKLRDASRDENLGKPQRTRLSELEPAEILRLVMTASMRGRREEYTANNVTGRLILLRTLPSAALRKDVDYESWDDARKTQLKALEVSVTNDCRIEIRGVTFSRCGFERLLNYPHGKKSRRRFSVQPRYVLGKGATMTRVLSPGANPAERKAYYVERQVRRYSPNRHEFASADPRPSQGRATKMGVLEDVLAAVKAKMGACINVSVEEIKVTGRYKTRRPSEGWDVAKAHGVLSEMVGKSVVSVESFLEDDFLFWPVDEVLSCLRDDLGLNAVAVGHNDATAAIGSPIIRLVHEKDFYEPQDEDENLLDPYREGLGLPVQHLTVEKIAEALKNIEQSKPGTKTRILAEAAFRSLCANTAKEAAFKQALSHQKIGYVGQFKAGSRYLPKTWKALGHKGAWTFLRVEEGAVDSASMGISEILRFMTLMPDGSFETGTVDLACDDREEREESVRLLTDAVAEILREGREVELGVMDDSGAIWTVLATPLWGVIDQREYRERFSEVAGGKGPRSNEVTGILLAEAFDVTVCLDEDERAGWYISAPHGASRSSATKITNAAHIREIRSLTDNPFPLDELLMLVDADWVRCGQTCALPWPVKALKEIGRMKGSVASPSAGAAPEECNPASSEAESELPIL